MKCPSCGAEIENDKVCHYCGTQITQQMREEQDKLYMTGCPRCGSINIQFTREKCSEVKSQNSKSIIRETVGCCKDCGYTWRPKTEQQNIENKKRKTWLWVLGWICIFPLPLTILLLRKKEMKSVFKYGLIVVAWILYLAIGFSTQNDGINSDTDNNKQAETETIQKNENVVDSESYIDTIVKNYNSQATDKLIYTEKFTPSDKTNTHYRTEFRLGAYSEAIGKSYTLSGKTVDLVATKVKLDGSGFRLYASDISLEQVENLILQMSPLMDENLSAKELNDAVNKLMNDKTANGLYFGELGVTLLANHNGGYNLMIKND